MSGLGQRRADCYAGRPGPAPCPSQKWRVALGSIGGLSGCALDLGQCLGQGLEDAGASFRLFTPTGSAKPAIQTVHPLVDIYSADALDWCPTVPVIGRLAQSVGIITGYHPAWYAPARGTAIAGHSIAGCGRNTQMLELGCRTTRFAPWIIDSLWKRHELPARPELQGRKEMNHE
jgi:hypothetical protein